MASHAELSCRPGRNACMRRWSSSLIITQRFSSWFRTSPLPTPLAWCSRLIKWRSTRICFSITLRLSMDSENAPAICGKVSTAGRISSSAFTRSGFLAQPGNGIPCRLRASRTRLDITIRSCGPSRLQDCAAVARNSLMFFMTSARGQAVKFFPGLFDLVTQQGGLLEILVADGLFQLFLQPIQSFNVIFMLLQLLGDFADVPGPFVHGLEQPFQSLGKRRVTIRAAEPSGLLKVGLGKTARRAFEVRAGAGLRHFLRRAQSEQKIGQRKARGIVNSLLLRARFAQVHLLGLALHHLGQVDGGHVLFADVAKHIFNAPSLFVYRLTRTFRQGAVFVHQL